MKYFLDFEGTQFSHRIISIGATCENGHSFYSLVKPNSKYKISEFITELTGITEEDIDNAKNAVDVFEEFYEWVMEQEDGHSETGWMPEWFCWGSEDILFIKGTFSDCCASPVARFVLGDMAGGLNDFGTSFCNKYNIKQRGLLKVAQAFDHTKTQDHNALSDALLLKFIYEKSEEYTKGDIKKMVARLTEVETLPPQPKWTESDLPKGTIVTISNSRKIKKSFASAEEAAKWIIKEKKITNISEEVMARRIAKAAKKRETYYAPWRMIGE